MKAFQLLRAGQMGELRDVDVPMPKAGEILVKIGGAGLCHSDLHCMHAGFPPLPYLTRKPPFTLGHEAAGWIEALGSDIPGLEKGMPVIVYPSLSCGRCVACHDGQDHLCETHAMTNPALGLGADGAIAKYMLVKSARQIIPIGDLNPRSAAPLTDAALSPYRSIRRNLERLRPNSSVVVIGVGGLGQMALQLLTALTPAQVIAVDRSPEKLALAKSLGARVTVPADDDAAKVIREATQGRGAALVLDIVGVDATLKLAAKSVAIGGRIDVLGVGGGSLKWNLFDMPAEASIGSSYWGSPSELREVVALAQAGRIRTNVQYFDIEDTAEAYRLLEDGKVEGRIVITPNGRD
ncbi:NAD(P)-dependent alcohol dehydrogenase [Variovorax robiniae]|uniref:alcohol dehydrogenase n=1 Tax=Variovorax robiniae TaxID=1836199 RepID=A0ABU8XD67_9BURK